MLVPLALLAVYVVFLAYDEYADILVGGGKKDWSTDDLFGEMLDGGEEPFWLNDLALAAWKCLRRINAAEVIKR